MKKETRFVLVTFVSIFVIALLSILFPQVIWTLPAFIPIGAMGLGFWLFMEAMTEICRGRTEHILYNHGHRSIREKDIAKMPYHEIIAHDENKKPVSLGDIVLAFTGGFDFWGFTMPGKKTDPVLIYPSYCHGKEENNYHSYANMTKYSWKELPKDIKRYLKLYPHRVDFLKTEFYYGMTSHLLGTATKENLKIEERERELNKQLSEKDDVIDGLLELIRKLKESQEKQYILGHPIKPMDEVQQ